VTPQQLRCSHDTRDHAWQSVNTATVCLRRFRGHIPFMQSKDKWTDIISDFLREAGLGQALRGLREDLLVLSPEWEANNVGSAFSKLKTRLLLIVCALCVILDVSILIVMYARTWREITLGVFLHFKMGLKTRKRNCCVRSKDRIVCRSRM
jgi:hypothetical protein